MKTILKIVFLQALVINMLLLLAACRTDEEKGANIGIYKPELNSMPKYFLKVSGTVTWVNTPSIVTLYSTRNPKCMYMENDIEGVSSNRYIEVVNKVQVNKENRYSLEIPLDKYKPGYCEWQISVVGYTIYPTQLSYDSFPILSFGKNGIIPASLFGKDVWHCNDAKCKEIYIKEIQSDINKEISYENDYSYVIDVEK